MKHVCVWFVIEGQGQDFVSGEVFFVLVCKLTTVGGTVEYRAIKLVRDCALRGMRHLALSHMQDCQRLQNVVDGCPLP